MNIDFSSNQYVPVLRWKAAEVDAMFNLATPIRARVTPLIELCPSMFNQKKKNKKGDRTISILDIPKR